MVVSKIRLMWGCALYAGSGKAISPESAASGPNPGLAPANLHRRSRGNPSSRSQAMKNPAERAGGIVCLENPRLAGGVAGDLNHDEFAIAGAPGANVEALVVFLKHQLV